MVRAFAIAAAIALLCLDSLAQANVFNLDPGLTNLETVPVGDPGNAGDYRYGSAYWGTGPLSHGAVSYTYNIGKHEVTAAHYTDFLNHKAKSDPYGVYNLWMDAALYNLCGCNIQRGGTSGSYTYSVAPDWANRPVNYVSFWDACRFANWLNNGQGDGDTETGAYTLNGYNGNDGRTIARNAGAEWFLPSEDEWYKAAFYKGGGTNAGYWDYATQSDSAPDNRIVDPDPGNNSSNWTTIGSPYFRTEVGEFENSESAYGTFDQCGNVCEWNETLQPINYPTARGMRGDNAMSGGGNYPLDETANFGFRVAAVPEPSTLLALLFGVAGIAWRRRLFMSGGDRDV